MSSAKVDSKSIKNIVVLFVVAVSVYIGFEPLINFAPKGIAQSVVGSAFSAIFVMILTMYLLNKQTDVEQQAKRGERLFEERVKLFQEILAIAEDIISDDIITKEGINRLPFPFMRLCMLCDEAPIKAFQKLHVKFNEICGNDDEFLLGDDDRTKILSLLIKFSDECRIDLQVSTKHLGQDLFDSSVIALSETVKKKDYSKFTFNGVELSKAKYIHAVIKSYADNNPEITLREFSSKIPRSTEFRKDVWVTYDEAEQIKVRDRARHYLKDDEVVYLTDAKICVTNGQSLDGVIQWIDYFKKVGVRHK